MNPSERIRPIPLPYTDIHENDRIRHIKFKRKLKSIGNLGKYIPFKNIQRITIYDNFQGRKYMKNTNILKTLAGVKSFKWTNLKNEDEFRFAYHLIKRCKKLTKLSFERHPLSQNATPKASFWFGKIVQVAKKVEILHFFKMAKNKQFGQDLTNIFKMKNLRSFRLNLDTTSRSNCQKICQFLSSKESLEHLALNITFYGFSNCFPIAKIKSLREFSFRHIFKAFSKSKFPYDFSKFFDQHPFLETLDLKMRLDDSLLETFTLDSAQNLKYLTLEPLDGTSLTDKGFIMLTERLKACKELKEVKFKPQHCYYLTDNSIQKLNEALEALPNLQTYLLHLTKVRRNRLLVSDIQPVEFTWQSIYHIIRSITKIPKLTNLELDLSNFQGELDEEVNELFDKISTIQNLKDLRIDLSSCRITNNVLVGVENCLTKLINLESFRLNLRDCRRITIVFLERISSLFIQDSYITKRPVTLHLSVPGTFVRDEDIKKFHSKIRKYDSKCRIRINIV